MSEHGDVFVRLYQPGDEVVLGELFTEAFGYCRSLETWRWRNFGVPGGREPYIRVLVAGGEVVGHSATVYFRTFVAGEIVTLAQAGDYMIRPDWRGKGIGTLLREYSQSHPRPHPIDLRMAFPIDKVRDRMAARPRPMDTRMLPQLVRWHPLAVAVRPWWRRGLRFEEVSSPGEEFDSLASSSARFVPCIRVRDAAYVQWRWLDNPGGSWTLWAARRRDGSLAGWVVGGHHHDDPPDRWRIVDLLAGDFATTRRLLGFAGARLRAGGASVVTLELLDPRPWMRRACLAAGFLDRGVGPNITLRTVRPDLESTGGRLENWYLTFGDTDLV
jgi:GNAT superfamily N-acetyltransferase